MSELAAPPVADQEELARYIYFSRYIRTDKTIRPEALVPHPYPDLSVTRHRDLNELTIWKIGAEIARVNGTTLHGRADLQAVDFRRQHLKVDPAPVEGNANHANVTGWPIEKSAQKNVAQKIMVACRFMALPEMEG
jgi:hypothetical protein